MRPKLVKPSPTKLERAAAGGEGIEHAYIDVWMRGEGREADVLGASIHVIDQQPDLDAAIRGFEQLLGDENAGEVRMPDVGLHVESAPGQPRTLHPGDKGFGAFLDEPECRFARMLRLGRGDDLIEAAVLAGRDGAFVRQRRTRFQLRARGEARDDEEDQAASK